MAVSAPRRRGSSSRERALAIAVSASGHVAVFVFLVWHLHWRGEDEAPAAMEVELMRPTSPGPRAAPERRAQPARAPRPEPPTPVLSPRGDGHPTPPPTRAEPPVAAPPAAPPPGDLSRALRGSLGCAHADYLGMSPAERRMCDTRMAGPAGAEGPGFGVDPRKRAAFDLAARREDILQRPFLAERPTKGCKPRVFEHESGAVGRAAPNWTASIACAIRF